MKAAEIHRDTVASLALATPPAIATHFGSLRRCMEAAVCGSRLLRESGIEARILPCAMRAWDRRGSHLTAGYSLAEINALVGRAPAALVGGPEETSFHVVIEARPAGVRTIIDLTAGQVIPIELALVCPWPEGWPRIISGEWTIEYADSPRASAIEQEIPKAEEVAYGGLIADIRNLQELAFECRLDNATFYGELKRQKPSSMQIFSTVVEEAHAQFTGQR